MQYVDPFRGGGMMKNLVRHIGIFCGMLGIAALVAFIVPLDVDPRSVFFVFTAAFFVYLGAALTLGFRKGSGA
jgi:hypothetical protein